MNLDQKLVGGRSSGRQDNDSRARLGCKQTYDGGDAMEGTGFMGFKPGARGSGLWSCGLGRAQRRALPSGFEKKS